MRGIASVLEFNETVEAEAATLWNDLTNDGKVGADRIYNRTDKKFGLPASDDMQAYTQRQFELGIISEDEKTEIEQFALVRQMNHAFDSVTSSADDGWTPQDIIDLVITKPSAFQFSYSIEPLESHTGIGYRGLYATPYSMYAYASGREITLFDIASRMVMNPLLLSSRVFPETTVADLANCILVENGEDNHYGNNTNYEYTSDGDISEIHGMIREHAGFGESSLWLSLVSWNTHTYMDIAEATRILSEHHANPAEILECLRLSGKGSSEILRYHDRGYSAGHILPYFRAGITDEKLICDALENDIDPMILTSL